MYLVSNLVHAHQFSSTRLCLYFVVGGSTIL